MWYLQLEVRPVDGSANEPRFGGANICCWVDTADEDEALAAADVILEGDGWATVRIEESGAISRESQSAKGMRYFEQAEEDGIAYLALTWPK